MRKSSLIATCLINSGMRATQEEAEMRIADTFNRAFPNLTFELWNSNIDESRAEHIIASVGKASEINVENFIRDLT